MAKSAARAKQQRSYKLPDWDGLCIDCGRSQEEVNFRGGKAGQCSGCFKQQWDLDNVMKVRCQRLSGNAQKRAKALGWPAPDFGSLWIEDKIVGGHCEVTGIPFDLSPRGTGTSHVVNPWVPSLDRINSSLPYSKSNVQVVVYMYNTCKAEFSHEYVVKFCRAVASRGTEIG